MFEKEILPLRTLWVNLEGFVLAEISQRKTVFTGSCLYLRIRKAELMEAGSGVVAVR